jgi:uncharacterized membrane protein YccC
LPATLLGTAVMTGLLTILWPEPTPFAALLALKVAYGALLAGLAAPVILQAALADAPNAPARPVS